MMNPTSNIGNGISSEQTSQLSLTSSSQTPPFTSTLQQQQQQHNLALQWLQQQQQEQQQQNTLKRAILAAAVAQQQEQQSLLRPIVSNAISPPIASSTSDIRNRQLLEMELCRQVLLQQQRLAQTRESLSIDHTKTILQDRLGHILTANAAGNQEKNSVVSATSGGGSTGTIGPAELDRLLEAETLLQRNRLQDAIRMLQIQGVLQEDHSVSRIVNNNSSHDNNAFATSALLLSNGPITPNTIGQATLTNNTLSQLLQPGILNMGQVVSKRPRMNDSIDERLHIMTNNSKRKSDSTQSSSTKETLQKKVKSEDTRVDKVSTFPLPSINRTRGFKITLRSFQDVWDELETTPLQQEIFIRRLYKYDCKLVD